MTAFKKDEDVPNPLMATDKTTVVRLPNGDVQIDPFGRKHKNDRFFESLQENGRINFYHFENQISKEASKLVVQFLFDMWYGKNLAKGIRKRALSANSIFNYRTRLPRIIEMLESFAKTELLNVTDDHVHEMFRQMREGIIKTKNDKPFKDTRTYAKFFASFWRWHMRIQKKSKTECPDIVCDLDLSRDEKPKWNFFNYEDVKQMSEIAPTPYYRALVLFLFDSGIRPPKELMNVRVKDLTPVPDSDILFLQIRHETSKTFGRKIKLMLSSEMIKRYLAFSKKKPDDFLFDKSYSAMTLAIKKLGYHVLGNGEMNRTKYGHSKVAGGISLYDFRHCSVCHYLPIYKSENQMKYRYGWKKAEMIHYYSEYIGMADTISEEDVFAGATSNLEQEKQKVQSLQEQLMAQQQEMEAKMKRMEAMLLQKFAENY